MTIAVIVPVLGRPQRAAPLVESLAASTDLARPVFVCSPSDVDEIDACLNTGATVIVTGWDGGRGDYARKINLAFRETGDPFVFQAADDLRFEPGWADRALDAIERLGMGVVGTNDLGHPAVVAGLTSTHSLIRRSYVTECGATFDTIGDVLHEGYWHNYVDVELVARAKRLGCYASCLEAVVEHLHPNWGKGAIDATYELGLYHASRYAEDGRLYQQRERLPRHPRRSL